MGYAVRCEKSDPPNISKYVSESGWGWTVDFYEDDNPIQLGDGLGMADFIEKAQFALERWLKENDNGDEKSLQLLVSMFRKYRNCEPPFCEMDL